MRFQEKYSDLTDDALLVKISLGDQEAFRVIYDRYIDQLYRYACTLKIDSDETEDILQEVFSSIWSRRHSLKIENLRPWLYMSVRKKVLLLLRKEKYRTLYQQSLAEFINPFWDPITDQLQVKQLEEFILREIEKLPKKMQEVFVLSRQENLSHKEIAQMLSISEGTVRKQINYALRIFRSKINVNDVYLLIVLSYLQHRK